MSCQIPLAQLYVQLYVGYNRITKHTAQHTDMDENKGRTCEWQQQGWKFAKKYQIHCDIRHDEPLSICRRVRPKKSYLFGVLHHTALVKMSFIFRYIIRWIWHFLKSENETKMFSISAIPVASSLMHMPRIQWYRMPV